MTCLLHTRPLIAAAIFALAIVLAPAAEARTEYPVLGGSGDITNASECPVGHFLVGFRGRVGLWIDQIRIRCAPLLDGGGVGESVAQDGVGGSGGSSDVRFAKAKCKPGRIITDLNFWLTNGGRQVELIVFTCRNPDDRVLDNTGHYFGNPGGVRFIRHKQVCPEGEAAVGLEHRWGAHVNAIGLICDVIRRP